MTFSTATRTAPGTTMAFLGPFMSLFALFILAPIGYSLYQSLFALRRAGAFGQPESTFVGLANYGDVLADPVFRSSVSRVAMFGVGPSLTLIVISLFVALLIDDIGKSWIATFGRLATFVPFAVPVVIGATIWGFFYAPSISPVLGPLDSVGLGIDPFASPVWAIGNVSIWTYAGFNTLIFLSALAALDRSLVEAARVDGAGTVRTAWHVKIPHLRPAILLSAIFNLIGTLQLFTEPTVLRQVNPVISSTWSPMMLAFRESAAGRISSSAAVAVMLAVVTGLCSFALLAIAERGSSE